MRDLITDDFARLMYRCLMGGTVAVISSNNERASECFRQFREAILEVEDEMRLLMLEFQRELIYGQPTGQGLMGLIDASPTSKPKWQRKWYNPGNWRPIRKARESQILCRRCRWRSRESRKSLEGLSPRGFVLDELEV